ncbi:acetylornithine aminotransferase [Coemansia interrupta]|uniref:acetylornithine transaminase n=1 Tax=Coemansia interrupta TaxID=1126814 RepID=A0A9W8HBJ5_9FUNG|nr:acetylornithine aminotransferase [Coemansia interrupta]
MYSLLFRSKGAQALSAAGARVSARCVAGSVSSIRGYRAASVLMSQGSVAKQAAENNQRFMVNTYSRPEIVLSHGKGSYVYDTDGKEYLDFTAGIAVVGLGHSHPDVAAAVSDQATKLVHCSNLYHNEWAPKLAQKIVSATLHSYPQGSQGIYAKSSSGSDPSARVFFSNSGTEANEGALKFARKYGKIVAEQGILGKSASEALRGDPNLKSGIVSFTGAFHGRSMGALSVTANPKYQKPFAPLIPGVQTMKFNDTRELGTFIDERTCAVIVEPIQGEGGIHAASVDFLRALRRRCDQVGALLIYDEIQCGLGRSGKLWAHQLYPEDCSPDIVTMAKPLANGIPIGAILVSDKVADMIKVGDHGTTFGGNPLACHAGCVVLDHINTPELLSHVAAAGETLEQELTSALAPLIGGAVVEIRGTGLLRGIQLNSDPTPVVNLARDRGLLLVSAGGNTVRLVPPLNTSIEDIKKGAAILAECIKQSA